VGEVFSGFVLGFALAVISTPLLSIMLLRMRTNSVLLGRMVPVESSAVGFGVVLHGALLLGWTMFGMILGLILLALEDAGAALGSPNAPYSLFVLTITLAVVAPIIVLLPSLRVPGIVGFMVVVLVFGWLMPYMAGWSRFDTPPKEPEPRFEVFNARSGSGEARPSSGAAGSFEAGTSPATTHGTGVLRSA
jgi:hypothetical protein